MLALFKESYVHEDSTDPGEEAGAIYLGSQAPTDTDEKDVFRKRGKDDKEEEEEVLQMLRDSRGDEAACTPGDSVQEVRLLVVSGHDPISVHKVS